MIFKLEFPNKSEFAQSKTLALLQKEYAKEYGKDEFMTIKSVTIIEDEVAKTIMLKNTDSSTYDECPEFSLYDTVCGNDFCVVGSTEWD